MRGRDDGITIVEVLITALFLAVSLVSLGLAVLTGVRSTTDLGERNLVHNQALSYMERLQKLNFGTDEDLPPSPAELDQLFDDSLDVPDLSLYQLHRPVYEDGHRFQLAGFERSGTWEVRVHRDLNGNGVLDPEEDKDDLLRIEILFNQDPVLSTFRARPAVTQ
jgi:hypothetical protein